MAVRVHPPLKRCYCCVRENLFQPLLLNMSSTTTYESFSVQGVTEADGSWTLTFSPDALHLDATSGAQAGRRVTVTREALFLELEYREWLGLLVILQPKRIGLRLSEGDRQQLRRWLGPPGQREVEHVVRVRLRPALFAYLALAAFALFYSGQPAMLGIGVLGAGNAALARIRARPWQLLVDASICVALAAYSLWRLLGGQIASRIVEIILVGVFLFGARSAWRAYRLLTTDYDAAVGRPRADEDGAD